MYDFFFFFFSEKVQVMLITYYTSNILGLFYIPSYCNISKRYY